MLKKYSKERSGVRWELCLFLALFSVFAVSPTPSIAKTCECQQHSAEASGEGSCSLDETSSQCDISYSAASSIQHLRHGFYLAQFNQDQFFNDYQSLMQRDPTFEYLKTFEWLDSNDHADIIEEEFLELVVRTMLSHANSDMARAFVDDRGVIEDAFKVFSDIGCINLLFGPNGFGDQQFNDSTKRFLLIAKSSSENRFCPGPH